MFSPKRAKVEESADSKEKKRSEEEVLVSPLAVGDIVVELTRAAPTQDKLDSKKISELAGHGTIFIGGGEVVHATPNNKTGRVVQKHEIEDIFERDKRLGSVLVLHCTDPKIRESISSLAFAAANKGTPFTYYKKRRRDYEENTSKEQEKKDKESDKNKELDKKLDPNREKLEFYRAFRAFYRIKSDQPISKKKGVSCGNFVSYIVKAAIIDQLFPKGLPVEVKAQLELIEELRISKGKKLDKVDIEAIELFEKIVKAQAPESSLLAALYRPVKKRSLNEFVESAFKMPEILEPGYLFYNKDPKYSYLTYRYPDYFSMHHSLYAEYEDIVKMEKEKDAKSIRDDKGLNLYNVKKSEEVYQERHPPISKQQDENSPASRESSVESDTDDDENVWYWRRSSR